MDDRDYGTIGAVLSSIIGVIALVYGLPEVKAFGGVIIGGAVTYIVQTKLQNQAEKNKIRKQNMEETLIPVFLMLGDIKRNLETADLFKARDDWYLYKKDYRKFIFTEELFNELDVFFKSYSDYRLKLANIMPFFFPIINKLFEKHFFLKIESTLKIIQNDVLPCFRLYWNDFYYDQVPLDEPLILGYDPFVVYQRKYENFNISKVEIIVNTCVYDEKGVPSSMTEHKLYLKNHMDLFNDFIESIKKEFDVKQDAIELRDLNIKLINSVSKSILKLEKYIDRYYPVEPIK